MAKNTVPVNFKDDIMNSSMGGKRRYKMIDNSDGTISLEDATTYDQVGSNFGAAQINATNQAVNAAADAGKIIDDIDAINNVTQEGYIAGAIALKQVNSNLEEVNESLGGLTFEQDTEGNWGYKPSGADAVIPFKSSNVEIVNCTILSSSSSGGYSYFTFAFDYSRDAVIYARMAWASNTKRALHVVAHYDSKTGDITTVNGDVFGVSKNDDTTMLAETGTNAVAPMGANIIYLN